MRRKSWKTTYFGYLAAVGVAFVTATRTGIIDGSKVPDWLNLFFGVCGVLGTAGLGQFARDSGITDEESGAKEKQVKRDTEFFNKTNTGEVLSGDQAQLHR